jgi:hypothetical protein
VRYQPMTRERLLNLPDGTVLQSGLSERIYTKTRGRLINKEGGFLIIDFCQKRAWRIIEELTNNEEELWV